MKSDLLGKAEDQIAETNSYLMKLGEKPISDPRAIEMVRETGQYAKNSGANVSDYVYINHDINQLTRLLAKGASEKYLTKFYENPIKDNVDLDTMPENYEESLKRTGDFFNYQKNGTPVEPDPYQNINLEKFFELPTEEKISYLSKLKNFGKKALPVALAASLVAAPVAGYDYMVDKLDFPGNETNNFEDTNHFFSFVHPSELYDNCLGFDREYKLQEELIKTPDKTTEDLKAAVKYTYVKNGGFGDLVIDNQLVHFDRVSGTELDLGVWLASSASDHQDMSRYMIGLDTDGDDKIETLAPMYNQYKGSEDITPIKNHALKVPKVLYDNYGNKLEFGDLYPAYVIDIFSQPKNPEDFSSAEILAYWKNTDGIKVTDKVIYYSDIIGKNSRMLGLDEYNNPNDVYYKGDFDVHGDDDNWGYPDWFEGTETDTIYGNDNAYNLLDQNTFTEILRCVNGFEEAPLDLNESIPTPDKINLFIMNNMYENRTCLIEDYQDDGRLEKGKIHLPETYLTMWGLSARYIERRGILPELVYVSVDDDPEPEHLISVKRTIHKSKENDLTKALGGHVKLAYFREETNSRGKIVGPFANYLVNLQDTQPEFEKLKRGIPVEGTRDEVYAPHLYIEDYKNVVIFGPESEYPPIGFKELYDEDKKQFKIPRELGLTEDNSPEPVLKKPLDEFNMNKDCSEFFPEGGEYRPEKSEDKIPLAGMFPDGVGALEVGAGIGAALAGAGAMHFYSKRKSGPTAI
ncbi:MAG: hypothetical protein KAT28_01480 [Candidatus Aenigmarchaeota archaeon]|nr:hypothetical protein [Candidatus Aenigmarchaeota archaeon]